VSVCVASIAEDRNAVVVTTDQMASMTFAGADHVMVKGDFLGLEWFAMWSGEDITPVPAILARASESLRALPRPHSWSASQVSTALAKAYQDETLHRAVAEYLSPYGLGMTEFLANGEHIFGTDYATKRYEIEQYDLGIDFLVAGYHEIHPHVFTVARRGIVRHYNKPGFWAIGSGHQLALGTLALRGHNSSRSTAETLYAVLESKFAAEIAPGVGQHTTAGVLTAHSIIRLVPKETIAEVRRVWEAQGRSAPPEALTTLNGWWKPVRLAMEKANYEQLERTVKQLRDQPANLPSQKRSTRGRKGRPPSQG
jgi:hypothetical protein